MTREDISVVLPVYNEEKNIEPLYEELSEALTGFEYEILFVDDGSSDDSFTAIQSLAADDDRVRGLQFQRNRGQTAALSAGFDHSRNDVIVALDADLQNDPQDIPRLVEELKSGYDCVVGWRRERNDTFFKQLFSWGAYQLRRFFLSSEVHDSGCTLKAFRADAIQAVDLHGEMHRFIPELLTMHGFSVAELPVNHRARKHGETKYTVKRLMKGFVDLLTVKFWQEFASRPMHLFGGSGMMLMGLGGVGALYSAFLKLFRGVDLSAHFLPSLSLLIIILGVQFLIFGLLANLLMKLYYKDSVRYRLRATVNLDD